jgi:hypothetical protein
MNDERAIDEWLAKTFGPEKVSPAKAQLVELIREGLESGEAVEVTDEWWLQFDRDLSAIRAFMNGEIPTLLGSPRLESLVKTVAEADPQTSPGDDYWNMVRNRLRTARPPRIYV